MSLMNRYKLAGQPLVDFNVEAKKLYEEAKDAVKRTKSQELWEMYGYTDIENWKLDYKRGQTNLFWLCTVPLAEPLDLLENENSLHRMICGDFFIKKDPYIEARTWKEAVSKQSTIKNRMLLYPRGTFKSSIDRIDVVQWIICFQNIRVLVMTAEETLAESFVKDIRKHFLIPENNRLTQFQMLYFQHCWEGRVKGATNEFTTKARTQEQPEPTVLALSLGMSTAGKHFDVGKYDDCVSETNSGPRASVEARKTVSDDLKLKRYLIDGYGYRDYVGTIYDPEDAYAILQRTIPELHVYKRPAMWLKSSARTKPRQELTENDWDLLFPYDSQGVERLTYKFLKSEQDIDEYLFSCQYLLEPLSARTVRFTEQLLRSHITQSEGLPQPGTYRSFSAWDLAYSIEAGRDYSVGTVGWFGIAGPQAGRVFIVDIVRGRFSKSELAFQIAEQAAKWNVERIGIENSPGAQFLDTDIRLQLIRAQYSNCPIDYFPIDNHKGAKNARAETLETLLVAHRLWLASDIGPVLEEVITEFVHFKPALKRKDDCVDSIAHLVRYLPTNVESLQTQAQNEAVFDVMKQKQLREYLYDKDLHTTWRDAANPPQAAPMPLDWEGAPINCSGCALPPQFCICR